MEIKEDRNESNKIHRSLVGQCTLIGCETWYFRYN